MSTAVTKLEPKRTILGALADRYGMDPKAFEITVRKMAMPAPHSDEEFAACCLVAKEHNLNPFTKEIYFMRTKGGAIQPIVGVDGWIRKCNEHPAFDGIDFEDVIADSKPVAIKCMIRRKDRTHPIVVTEYLAECLRPTDNWKSMPSRMLRHRALIQCARIAFGFAGIMDPDEFEAWQERYRGEPARDVTPPKSQVVAALPDIPDEADNKPDTSANGKAQAPQQLQAGDASGQPDKRAVMSDQQFMEALDAAYATANDLDALNEHMTANELEIEERGLQQACADIYRRHMGRIYDRM